MPETTIASVLDRPDQERVLADLTCFFGPNAETYLATYDKMRARTGRGRTQVRGWNWPVFLFGFTWYFYRKMPLHGALILLLPIVIGLIIPRHVGGAFAGLAAVLAMTAKGDYVQTALRRLMKADELSLAGAERIAYLERAGGVSLAAGAIAGLVYLGALALTLIALFGPHRY